MTLSIRYMYISPSEIYNIMWSYLNNIQLQHIHVLSIHFSFVYKFNIYALQYSFSTAMYIYIPLNHKNIAAIHHTIIAGSRCYC